MANTRKYTVTEMRAAIDAVGASPAAIAEHLGCSRATVYSYLRKYPELKREYEAQGEAVQERVQYSREKFEAAIAGSRGVKTAIARRVGCTRQTVDNALERWPDLAVMIEQERESIVDLAEVKLFKAIKQGDVRSIHFTLETLGKGRGWTKRTEVTGADGAELFGLSPEVMELIKKMGIEPSEVVRQFEQMVKMAAAAKRITTDE